MIEVQKIDGSFITINPNMILTLESDKKKTVKDSKDREYTVNDYQKGTKFTLTFINGESMELSKLGIDILRQATTRADFNPDTFRIHIRYL